MHNQTSARNKRHHPPPGASLSISLPIFAKMQRSQLHIVELKLHHFLLDLLHFCIGKRWNCMAGNPQRTNKTNHSCWVGIAATSSSISGKVPSPLWQRELAYIPLWHCTIIKKKTGFRMHAGLWSPICPPVGVITGHWIQYLSVVHWHSISHTWQPKAWFLMPEWFQRRQPSSSSHPEEDGGRQGMMACLLSRHWIAWANLFPGELLPVLYPFGFGRSQ